VIAAAIRRPLTGLKVACYYGARCRAAEITAFDDPEILYSDRLMEMRASRSTGPTNRVLWRQFSITETGIVLQLTNEILSMAQGPADCIVTACPLCQMNLDLRQKDVEARFGRRYNLPVLFHTARRAGNGLQQE
jgi:heterodisulfide reductase subunit B